MSLQELQEQIRDLAAEHGYMVGGVVEDPSNPEVKALMIGQLETLQEIGEVLAENHFSGQSACEGCEDCGCNLDELADDLDELRTNEQEDVPTPEAVETTTKRGFVRRLFGY